MNHIHNISRGVSIMNDSVLLAFHKKNHYYFLPGGHVEIGESAQQALEREYKEEMNLVPTSSNFITTIENLFINNGIPQHEYTFIFSCIIDEKQKPIAQVDHLEFTYVPIDKLDSIKLFPVGLAFVIRSIYNKEKVVPLISLLGIEPSISNETNL